MSNNPWPDQVAIPSREDQPKHEERLTQLIVEEATRAVGNLAADEPATP